MARENSRFPYRLIVLGFPLVGGLFMAGVLIWWWASGGKRPPDPLAVPVEAFWQSVAGPIWHALMLDVNHQIHSRVVIEACWESAWFPVLAAFWELLWLALGVVVALLAWSVSLLVPRGKGEER